MAEIKATVKRQGSWIKCEWLAVTEADTFSSVYLNDNVSDIVIEAEGTWGSATLVLNGWVKTEAAGVGVVDPGGTAVSLSTSLESASVRDAYPNFRPSHSGGTSETIDVRLFMKVPK